MKTTEKRILTIVIMVLSIINIIYCFNYSISGIQWIMSCNNLGYIISNIVYAVLLLTLPVMIVISVLIKNKKLAFLSIGNLFASKFILCLIILIQKHLLHNHTIILFDYTITNNSIIGILITSVVTSISFYIIMCQKNVSALALCGCMLCPIYITVAMFLDAFSYRGFGWELPLLSIYALVSCVLCYFVNPKEKSQRNISPSSTYFEYNNIPISIVLSIITFGIYTIIWLVEAVRNTHKLHGINKSSIGEVLLILFVPFYSWYWFYTRGKQIFEDSRKNGGNIPDNSALYLVLAIFGLSLINLAIMQNFFNKYTLGTTVSQTQPQINSDIGSRLKELQGLASQGLITPEEYESKRKDILNRL